MINSKAAYLECAQKVCRANLQKDSARATFEMNHHRQMRNLETTKDSLQIDRWFKAEYKRIYDNAFKGAIAR